MRLRFATMLMLGGFLGTLGHVTAQAEEGQKKVKGQRTLVGAAGVVSTSGDERFTPLAIDGNAYQGVYCTSTTSNVHHLGTVPANWGVIIDFESGSNSDPIAILTTVKMNGLDVGAEVGASDDEGGNLNPRFELRRAYQADYILTVASADADEACYAYRMRLVQ